VTAIVVVILRGRVTGGAPKRVITAVSGLDRGERLMIMNEAARAAGPAIPA
jgi:hypothetical protein